MGQEELVNHHDRSAEPGGGAAAQGAVARAEPAVGAGSPDGSLVTD